MAGRTSRPWACQGCYTVPMKQRHLAIQISYQGTHFSGYGSQPNLRTVEGDLRQALARLLGAEPLTICAGRTDAGVHAYAQLVSFSCQHGIPTERIVVALNKILAPDIRAHQVWEVDSDFSARHAAMARHYRYLIRPTVTAHHPLLRESVWHLQEALDFDCLKRVWLSLQGQHHFRAFCKSGSYRTHFDIHLPWTACWRYRDLIVLEVIGQNFLYNMVRSLVGTVAQIAAGGLPEENLALALQSGERRWIGRTAPPQGLCLYNVLYPPESGIEMLRTDLHDWPVPLNAMAELEPLN